MARVPSLHTARARRAACTRSRCAGRHITLPLFARESTAFRFPAILFAALLVAMVYRFARGWLSRAARRRPAAVLALAQPHYFFHAPIACFDAPITTMAFAVGFAYWKSLRSPRWGIAAGVLFGIALGVKHNAWLMPFFLVAHYLWMRRGDLRRAPPAAACRWRSSRWLVLGPLDLLRALALAVERADRAHARVRQPPPAARALQLRVPRPELEQPADDDRDEAAPRDARRSSRPGSPFP